MVLLEFFAILEALDHQEGQAEQYGNNEVPDKHFTAGPLPRFHPQHYCQRADDKYCSIEPPHRDAELLASGSEGVEVGEPVNKVGAEHAAEEHDFSHQEQPHAKRGGVLLLLSVGEM